MPPRLELQHITSYLLRGADRAVSTKNNYIITLQLIPLIIGRERGGATGGEERRDGVWERGRERGKIGKRRRGGRPHADIPKYAFLFPKNTICNTRYYILRITFCIL